MAVSGAAATTAAAGAAPSTAAGSASTAAGAATCKCGVERTSSRVVGGTEVNPKNKYPWMVALVDATTSKDSFCGGTLVASKYVVSAAHCTAKNNASSPTFKVRIGEHDLTTSGEGSLKEMTIDVVSFTNHESYNTPEMHNDITIIELAQEVDLTTYTPACLAKTSDTTTFDGKKAWVYGWGLTTHGGSPSDTKLLEAELPVVTNTVCKTEYTSGEIYDGALCAGGEGKTSCNGDSGGPLSYKSGTQHVLIGAVSHGTKCGEGYGVYARISYYRTWIEGKMSSPKYCSSGADAA